MKIREYRSEDCPQLVALFRQSVHTVCVNDYSAQQLAAWAPDCVDPQAWDRVLRASWTLVAEYDGLIVGFGNMEATGYLDRLYVHRDFQRRGIANALCGRLEERFVGQTCTTHASITALPFFLRRGYRILREQEVARCGVTLRNYVMEKSRAEPVESATSARVDCVENDEKKI